MPDNVRTAGSCLIIAGCLLLATAGLVAFILVLGTVFVGWSGTRYNLLGGGLFGVAGFASLAVLAAAGIASLLAAGAVRRGQTRGRIAGVLLGVLMLPLFPVGTVLGGFVVAGLLGPASGSWFGAGAVSLGPRFPGRPPQHPPG
jgi:hypothetical protein